MRLFAFALIVVAFACGSPQKPQPLSERWSAPTMLSQVPADSPYVVAMLEPVPAAAKQQMFASTDQKLAAALEASRTVDRSQLDPWVRAYFAFLDEIAGKGVQNWGRELGFDPSGRFVLYGLSMWPVLRIAVADEARVRSVIERMLTAAGVTATPRNLRGRSYWQFDVKSVSVIGSIANREAVFAVMPTQALAQYLPHVLGFEKPAKSVHGSGSLNALLSRYRLLPTMVGYFDSRLAADIMLGRSSSASTELDKPLREALGPIGDTCGADIDRITGLVPRMVYGYRQIEGRTFHAMFALELHEAVAAALQRVRTTVPGLPVGIGEPSLIEFGIAANVDELLEQLRRLASHVREKPFTCPSFEELNEGLAKLATQLEQPLPSALHGMRGLVVSVEHLTKEPLDARGHAFFAADHAHDLLTFALRLVPGLSSVTVHPDARPVQIPVAALGLPESVVGYAATRVDRAAIAVGPSSATNVVSVLNRPAPDKSPLFSMAFHFPRLLELGLLEPKEDDGLESVTIQLDITAYGIAFEVYATVSPQRAGTR